jgi:hypothetical protein
VPGIICATTEQCVQKLGDDACKANITCDPADALCKYQTLDKDGDGHPPIVCGGDDCNDGDPTRFPGHPEACDGKDNDCDGQTDDGATCSDLTVCQGGACVCAPQNTCGAACVDKQNDPNFCGGCSVKCPTGGLCQLGMCKCPAGTTACGNACVNTNTDPKNCGGCNTQCSSCQNGACTKCPTVDLFIEQDLSGSMTSNLPSGATRWDAVRFAVNAFMADPLSTGLGLGIGYFPVPKSCVLPTDCGAFDTCTNGLCASGADSCKASDYAVPAVSLALLPSVSAAITNSMNIHGPTNLTPQAPALEGALTFARSFAIANASHKVAVVLITDGLPNECTPSDVPTDVANVASAFANGTPQVKTFVIGIGTDVQPPSKWSTIASAGGTGSAHLANSPMEIQTALNSVRSAFTACP